MQKRGEGWVEMWELLPYIFSVRFYLVRIISPVDMMKIYASTTTREGKKVA